LAKVRLAQGELRESVMVATRAIELGKHIRSTVVVEWLSRFGDELTSRHGNSPVVLPFRDRLREYAQTAASTPVR
jgi:hypothetical protein